MGAGRETQSSEEVTAKVPLGQRVAAGQAAGWCAALPWRAPLCNGGPGAPGEGLMW